MAANNIKIPKLVRAGESITAAWANDIRRAIIELANRAPAVKKAINQKRKPAPFTPTLKIEIVGEGEEATKKYFVRVSDGYLVDHVLPDEKSLSYIYPEGIKDELEKPVWHEIEDEQCLYLSFSVTITGAVDLETAPTIRVDEDDIENEHYRPTIFTEGGGGLSMYKLLKFTLPDDNPTFEYFLSGDNVHHWRERLTMRNIEEDALDDDSMGDRRPVGDRYDHEEDCAYFKYLVQLTGDEDGVPIIKPLPDGLTVDDVGYIPFRQIKDLGETSRQIKVSAEPTDGAITIRGNEVDASVSNAARVTMTVVDGLVTELSSGDGGDGQDLDLIVSEFNMTTDGGYLIEGTPAYPQYVECWREGVYVGSFDYGDPLPAATGGAVVLTTRYVSYVTLT